MQDMAVHTCRYVYLYHIAVPYGIRFMNRYYMFYLFDVVGTSYFVLSPFVLKINLVHPMNGLLSYMGLLLALLSSCTTCLVIEKIPW